MNLSLPREARTRTKLPMRTISVRQLEIFTLIGRGLTCKEIARALRLSVHTVKGHIATVYTRLDVHTQAGAFCRMIQLGLLRIEVLDAAEKDFLKDLTN